MKPYNEYIANVNQREIAITSAERIQKWIDERMKDNDYGQVLFSVLVLDPAYEKQVVELIKRNYPKYNICDTKLGCWCLNDDWYEFYADAITEYCGGYPIRWNIADVVFLEELYLRRKIYIDAAWVTKDGHLRPIH
jgi:hypothetical protein